MTLLKVFCLFALLWSPNRVHFSYPANTIVLLFTEYGVVVLSGASLELLKLLIEVFLSVKTPTEEKE